ncbi:glycosyltransferase [Paenibacillus silagei]|uniref:Glycosyltransferase involved in cell wall biosynthesis n=1 Tax=Paenibacillus silagei TaxID=1670801 RepID=A0ABS4NWI3_9BACL|nr:glycosyltransferase [Paenibacillus silagei]MBP2114403.1 glycosyltransferase involved in cell wall biosynthesis [Paenibacillus silagei]
MSNKLVVSIIVPIYNVEQYLVRCLKSLVNQTYKNIEIILVDDGSPDNCGDICDEYSKRDNRVKVVHKKNGGLSDARNSGLKIAQGEFVLFVDSDDFIELDAVEKLLAYANENRLDVVCGNAYRIKDANSSKYIMIGGTSNNKVMTGEQYLVDCIKYKKFSVAVWTRMYRRDLIQNNNIYFTRGLLHEDENWTPKLLLAAERVGYLNYSFYNYLIRDNSITQTGDKRKHVADVIKTCVELELEYNKLNINRVNKRVLKDYLVRLYINTCTFGEYDKKIYSSQIDKKFLIRNSYLFKTKLEIIVFILNISLYRSIKLRFS